MGKLTYIVIHCLDTPPELAITKEHLEVWHMAPKDLFNERVRYLGKNYKSREALPDHEMMGQSIRKLHGRGWDRLGYSELFHRDGEIEILTPYNHDDWVDRNEKTWGVAGYNSVSRHIALEGGWEAKRTDKFFDHFTRKQYDALHDYLKEEIDTHPEILVAGHNDFADRQCPGFRVSSLMDMFLLSEYAYVG